mgnify:CR=1 FL=1
MADAPTTTQLAFSADRANTYFPLTSLNPGESSEPFEAYFKMDAFWDSEQECVDVCERGRGIVAKLREGNRGYAEAKGIAATGTFTACSARCCTADGPYIQVKVLDQRAELPHYDSYAFSVC